MVEMITDADASNSLVLVEFVLDETGSMASCKNDTIDGFNLFLKEQRSGEGECLLTLTKFDSNGLRTPYEDLPINFAPEMTGKTFVPGSMTNLYDAVGVRLRSLQERMATFDIRPDAVLVVMTDGGDNSSREFDPKSLSPLIRQAQEEGITCVFLGDVDRALETAKAMGFPEGNSRKFSTERMHQTMSALSCATTAYRTTRAYSVGAETSYFGEA